MSTKEEIISVCVNIVINKGGYMANQAVYGIVKNRAQAERIIQALLEMGVQRHNVSFLSQHGKEFQDVGTTSLETNRNWRTEERLTDYPAGTTPEERAGTRNADFSTRDTTMNDSSYSSQGGLAHEKHTKAPEGATTGATTGGIIGGTLGLLAGIGALAIPGLGPFIAAGPLMATLSGLGAGGAIGGIIGALIGAGIPEFEAKRYENVLKEGGILLAVRAISHDEADRIKKVLKDNGAQDVTISSEASISKEY
jgi:hypothetical protein